MCINIKFRGNTLWCLLLPEREAAFGCLPNRAASRTKVKRVTTPHFFSRCITTITIPETTSGPAALRGQCGDHKCQWCAKATLSFTLDLQGVATLERQSTPP